MPKGLAALLAKTKESTGGGFAELEPGAYKLVITKVEPHEDGQYVRVYWDVAEGEHKGIYASSQYPPTDVWSWKDSALNMLKGKLHRVYECNPQRLHQMLDAEGNFASVEEFENDDYRAFVGCRFGAVVRRRLYTAGPNSKNPGADRTAIEIAAYLKPDEFRDGTWSESLLKDRDQRDKMAKETGFEVTSAATYQQSATPDLYDEDVPF